MKKIFTLAVMALGALTMTAQAQENLALGCNATADVGEAGLAIDGNPGTRWEAPQSYFTEANPQNVTWTLDLGEAKEFNTINIKWEGAYSKAYTIGVSDDNVTYTPAVEVSDYGFNPQTVMHKLDEAVTARYIKFTNVERGTQWGVSFWEFEVYNNDYSTVNLENLVLSTDKSTLNMTKNETAALSILGYDQYGQEMNNYGEVTYTVTPAGAGTVTAGVYTPAAPGTATIKANVGDVVSNEISIAAYDGEKIDIFSNWQGMVAPLNEATLTGSMVGAFDTNMGSVWELYGVTGASEEERTYTVGFTVDFQGTYDLTSLSMTFEGACPEDYKVVAIGTDGNETEICNVTGHPGMATYTDFYVINNVTARQVKFISTKAATQYGIKIFDFTLTGKNFQDLPDTQAPTGLAVEVASVSFSSITLKLSATDDVSSVITYEATCGDQTKTFTGENGKEVNAVFGGLTPSTDYTISVVAKDAKGNATETVTVTETTGELATCPTPTPKPENVFSVFGHYGNADGFIVPDWGQTTQTTYNEELKFFDMSNFNYQGFQFTKYDVSNYGHVIVDIYPIDCNAIGFVPIWRNSTDTDNAKEIGYNLILKPNQWNSVRMPIELFNDDAREGTWNVYQLKFDSNRTDYATYNPTEEPAATRAEVTPQFGTNYLVSNVYFEKQPTSVAGFTYDAAGEKVEIYDLTGRRVNNPEHGIYIVRQGNKTTKVIF